MSLSSDLRLALKERPPWPGRLTRHLARRKWSELAETGLTPENYGTLRSLSRDPGAPRGMFGSLPAIRGDDPPILVEAFPCNAPERYRTIGLKFGQVADERLYAAYSAATERLQHLPEAADAVSALIRSLHVLAIDDQDYDASYSDPEVPFSAFVGVHPARVEHDGPRLAEGLLHEAMHLQLTLGEGVEPLVAGCAEWRHSPWQDRARPVQGLLHGLFVFSAVRRLHEAVASRSDDGDDRRHAERRIRAIDQEVAQLTGLENSEDLTPDGRTLATTLLRAA